MELIKEEQMKQNHITKSIINQITNITQVCKEYEEEYSKTSDILKHYLTDLETFKEEKIINLIKTLNNKYSPYEDGIGINKYLLTSYDYIIELAKRYVSSLQIESVNHNKMIVVRTREDVVPLINLYLAKMELNPKDFRIRY